MLFGREIDRIETTKHGLEGNQLIFMATFTDGFVGIYSATIPAPGAALPLGLLGLWGINRRRRSPGNPTLSNRSRPSSVQYG